MAVMGNEARNPPPAEPRAQAVDEAIELSPIFMSAEADLFVRTGLGGEHGEPRQIETKTGIDLVAERGEPLHEERADRMRIAHRARGAGRNALDHAIGAEESKLEATGAVPARCQRRLEPRREPLDGCEHVLFARDWFVKVFFGDIGRDRQPRSERLVFACERAIEHAQEISAEAGGERRARQVEDVADAFQADPRQRGDHVTRQPQCRERQGRKKIALLIGWGNCRRTETRGGGGRTDAGGNGGACRKAEPGHPRKEIVAKFLFAAEEMRAAADVEQNAVGWIGGEEGRVALAPVGHGVEEARVGCLVLRHRGEGGVHGAGLCQREAGGKSEPLRRGIDRDEKIEIAALAEYRQGRR